MKDLKVGDKVWMGCYTSIGASSEGESTIEEVEHRYYEKTGVKYKVYKVGSHWFNQTGGCISENSMFYIEEMHAPSDPIPKKRIIDADTAKIYANFDMTAVKEILSDVSQEFKPKNKIMDRQYKELVEHILRFGYSKSDRTGTGTKSIFGWQIRHSMKDGFPLLTTKKMAFKTMVTELLWFLSGRTDLKWLLERNNTIWVGDAYRSYLSKWKPIGEGPIYINALTQEEFINKIKTDDEFAKKFGELGPVYGKQWRSWKRYRKVEDTEHNETLHIIDYVDQIANVINLLKTDPDSRRMIVNAWNPADLPKMVLPPCHMMFQFYTRELSWDERHELAETKYQLDDTDEELDKHNIPTRAISLRWDQRSVDVGLGLPFNIASYALLLEITAKAVNMVPEEVIGDLGDCHIYNNHIDGLKEQLTRTPYELPTVKIREDIIEHGNEDIDPIPWYSTSDFTLENYQSHPAIKLPLSN